MRLRPRRGIVIWSSSGIPGRSRPGRPARLRRIRWWVRTGTLLALIGVVRLARVARTRWEPVFLGAGATLMIIGFELPAAFVAFPVGMLVLVVTLLKGIAAKGRPAGQAADCWQWRG
jgi:uncharacterized membrane protein YdcZ (DUF606 family)